MIRFIATRLDSKGEGRVSRPAILVATASVAVGLMVMILTVCVSQGFKSEIHTMVRSTGGDLHIFNTGSIECADTPLLALSDSVVGDIAALDCVESLERVCTALGCLKTDSSFIGIQLVGRERLSLADNEIMLSEDQALKLGLAVGDRVTAYFFNGSLKARRFTVSATYATHLSDFDATQVFASLPMVRSVAGMEDDECNYVQVYCREGDDVETDALTVLRRAKELVPLTPTCQVTVSTLTDMHPQVFAWLGLLNLNVSVILVLMLCVAGFTMSSGLFILILERTQMIGLMKALGARFSTLRGIFICISAIILVRGMLIGNALALAIALAQRHWHIITLNPSDYYVAAVPIALPWMEIAAINLATMLLTLIVLTVPTYIIGRISPVKALRFE